MKSIIFRFFQHAAKHKLNIEHLKKTMKVLAISYLFPNRTAPNHGIFVLNRLKALKNLGIDITIVNPIAWSPLHAGMERYKRSSTIPTKDNLHGLDVYHPRYFSIPRFFKGIEALSYFNALAPTVEKIKKEFDFDLIDLHWTYPDLPAGTRLAKQYGKPLLVTLRGVEAFYMDSPGMPKRMVEKHIKRVDGTVALSQELKNIGDIKRCTNLNSFVVRNGVDTDNFYYQDKSECRKALDLPDETPIILSVGSLIYRKGFDLIIKALQKIVQTPGLEQTTLYIIGSEGPEGDYRKELRNQISHAKLENNVVFQGPVDNGKLRDWYNAADIFCLASRGEGSPNVLTEALACGCPAVAADVGSVKEILDSETNIGICIPPDNVDALSDALLRLLQIKWDRKQNAIKFGKYTWEWCAENVVEVYNMMLTPQEEVC